MIILTELQLKFKKGHKIVDNLGEIGGVKILEIFYVVNIQTYWEATDLENSKVSRSLLLGNVSYNAFKIEYIHMTTCLSVKDSII